MGFQELYILTRVLYSLFLVKYLVYITQKQKVGNMLNSDIYKIKLELLRLNYEDYSYKYYF